MPYVQDNLGDAYRAAWAQYGAQTGGQRLPQQTQQALVQASGNARNANIAQAQDLALQAQDIANKQAYYSGQEQLGQSQLGLQQSGYEQQEQVLGSKLAEQANAWNTMYPIQQQALTLQGNRNDINYGYQSALANINQQTLNNQILGSTLKGIFGLPSSVAYGQALYQNMFGTPLTTQQNNTLTNSANQLSRQTNNTFGSTLTGLLGL